jgi:hypothetical protein
MTPMRMTSLTKSQGRKYLRKEETKRKLAHPSRRSLRREAAVPRTVAGRRLKAMSRPRESTETTPESCSLPWPLRIKSRRNYTK